MKKVWKIIIKTLSIIWGVIGGLIFLWTGYWILKVQTIKSAAILVGALFIGMGLYALMIYLPITLVLLILYFIFRKK